MASGTAGKKDGSLLSQVNPQYYILRMDQLERASRQVNAAEEIKKRVARDRAKPTNG